ncbi:glycoside hydrolase family 97 protein [Flavobacterium nitrogenifigens]|uniref:Glycosyl-hydrolase 97 C-terminal, oligomerisation n=1 Tax=Flavobacterium nitrogenifigens TaxID=1617283 RepID=A0A521FCN9_9FLAO|nr:glycoside hydrolase family 97 protein [Flavobacterium nitrogenifigens]KAF2338663.1 glycoside hydrolase family 97 protein [Flavobacterium nitrogenifigens]SMO93962.1 Glycosyl-hydrolase 97 C-terminal, oligomerisation [Flavobacterium nitrogenifigens]
MISAARQSLFLILFLCSFCIDAQKISSPDGRMQVILNLPDNNKPDGVSYKVLYQSDNTLSEVVRESKLGITREDQQFVGNLLFVGQSESVSVKDTYEMICGKRKHCENTAVEKTFHFKNTNNQTLDIIFRVYNNGVAFRYVFPDASDSKLSITGEATTYSLPKKADRWMQPYDPSYERFFPYRTGESAADKAQQYGFPALYKLQDQPVWALISEADISEGNCGARLTSTSNDDEYQIAYPSAVQSKQPWHSQWHTVIIGKLSDIVASTLITDVSAPSRVKDTQWIKPGAVSWIYWANNRGSKDYQIVKDYIDLAVEMNWPYVLIDWEWDVMANGGSIIDAVNYAKSKSIKPMIWYNSGTSWMEPTPNDRLQTAEKRAKEFSWLNKIGVYGIKVDFFAGDQQEMMQYYIAILEDAAKYHLMVNFHGATVPRGWARTYPNLMSTEAVYGAEWYNNTAELTDKAAVHNTTLPFTRNAVGSMDYTPVTFSNSQHPHITSYGHELALAVVFESGLQHFADRPSAYRSLPEPAKEFLKKVPVSWDDTQLIDGFPGEKVIIARKKADKWYIGGLNGKDLAQTLTVTFDFLGKGTYSFELIKDGKDDKSFSSEIIKVKKGTVLKIECLPRGGFTGVIK